jgi:hypothetical protein
VRRRDRPQEPENPVVVENTNVMSDLNNFMMIEDLMIDEQEEDFLKQTRLNKEKKLLQNDIKKKLGLDLDIMPSLEEMILSREDQDNHAQDLGVHFDS